MRILQFTSSFPLDEQDYGGNFIRELIEELSSSFEFFVLTPDTPTTKNHESIDNYEIIRYKYFFKNKQILVCNDSIIQNLKKNKSYYFVLPLFFISSFISLIKIVNQKKINIVHAHWIFPQGFVAVLARFFSKQKFKILITSHGTDLELLNNFFLRQLIKFTLKKCECINPVSDYLKMKIIEVADIESKIHVIPMGTNRNLFGKKGEQNLKNINVDEKYILSVGRLSEGKDLETLIRSFKGLSEGYSDLFLYIVGTGNELDKLKELVNSLELSNKVRFLGQVKRERLVELYNKAQVLVSTSLSEGFGLVFIEALLLRCPVIATNVGGVGEIILHQETGILINTKQPEELMNAVKSLMKDEMLRKMLIENGYKHAINNYTWESVAIKFKSLYMSL
ncbi:MAG: glycosyltransferase family 4 protein [Ignavibacteriales bacterium]|nr:glycosyltransferase family 4 protein [Ignavibacteriales bacterium]